MIQEIEIEGKTYQIGSFVGKVIQASKDRETQVHGVGGGGRLHDGTGDIAPVSIGSVTILHDDLYLINEQGVEKNFRLRDWDISARVGHTMQVIWVVRPNKDYGEFVVVKNFNLDNELWSHGVINGMGYEHNERFRLISYITIVILAYVVGSWLVLFGGIIANFIYWDRMNNKVAEAIKAQVREFVIGTTIV